MIIDRKDKILTSGIAHNESLAYTRSMEILLNLNFITGT
jgi:hypothetical protein